MITSNRDFAISQSSNRIRKLKQTENCINGQSEEIAILKKELHNLSQEKSLLKAKISRLEAVSKKTNKSGMKSKSDQNSLEREYRQIGQMLASKRAEITQINSSDLASIITELHEECLFLHSEIIRVGSAKSAADIELGLILKNLNEAHHCFSREVEIKQRKMIRDLEKQIEEQVIRNSKIRSKFDERENESSNEKIDDPQIIANNLINSLEMGILKKKNDIIAANAALKEMEENRGRVIGELKAQL